MTTPEPARAAEEHRALVYAVHLADHIAMLGGSGTGIDTLRYPLDSGHGEVLGLGRDGVEAVMESVAAEFDKLASSLAEG